MERPVFEDEPGSLDQCHGYWDDISNAWCQEVLYGSLRPAALRRVSRAKHAGCWAPQSDPYGLTLEVYAEALALLVSQDPQALPKNAEPSAGEDPSNGCDARVGRRKRANKAAFYACGYPSREFGSPSPVRAARDIPPVTKVSERLLRRPQHPKPSEPASTCDRLSPEDVQKLLWRLHPRNSSQPTVKGAKPSSAKKPAMSRKAFDVLLKRLYDWHTKIQRQRETQRAALAIPPGPTNANLQRWEVKQLVQRLYAEDPVTREAHKVQAQNKVLQELEQRRRAPNLDSAALKATMARLYPGHQAAVPKEPPDKEKPPKPT